MSDDKIIDMSKETKVDWDQEISNGRLIPVDQQKEDHPDRQHVQNVVHSKAQLQQRVIEKDVARHICDTRRYPTRSTTKYFF